MLRVYLRRAATVVRRLFTRGWVIAFNLLLMICMANGINTATYTAEQVRSKGLN